VRLDNVFASNFDIYVGDGVIEMQSIGVHDVTIGGVTAAIASGDVAIAPANVTAVNLTWSQPCGYVCLPSGRFVDDSDCTTNDTVATTFDTDDSLTGTSSNCSTLSSCQLCNSRQTSCLECGSNTALYDGGCVETCPSGSYLRSGVNGGGALCALTRACQSRVCEGVVPSIRVVGLDSTMTGAFLSTDDLVEFSEPADVTLQIDASAQEGTIYLYDHRPVRPIAASNVTTTNETGSGRRTLQPELSDTLARSLAGMFPSLGEFDDGVFRIKLLSFLPDTLWLAATNRV
jgi:hypothetical protein